VNRELIIEAKAGDTEIALLEDKYLVELHKEKEDQQYQVGNIYLGRVRKIMPGLNAAFVDVGYEKDAFLHYLDLGPQVRSLIKLTKMYTSSRPNRVPLEKFKLEPDIEKTGKITGVLKSNMSVLVQIEKEPISTKGPRISSEISFAGRYLVIVPFSNKISVSQKIKSEAERNRLKRLIASIRPNNIGVIIRTVADGKKVADLDADLRNLMERWNKMSKRLSDSKPPRIIHSELDRTSTLLRDLMNDTFNSIHVNDGQIADDIRRYIEGFSPKMKDIVKVYKGHQPIFEAFGVNKQIKNSFGKTVSIKSGIYLVIEHTEALHVIDVNSGHRINKDISQEENALQTNVEAAAEIARQLRLRDMGGIIVVDFIDMTEAKNRRALYQRLKEEMAKDRAKHTILPPSKFGLVQITRQRVRPETDVEVTEMCPTCRGSGKVSPTIVLTDEIENSLRHLLQEQNEKFLKITVHPYVYAFLTKGFPSLRQKWFMKYNKWIRLQPLTSHHLLEYHIFNKNEDEIKM
jgi:ribonuclease G